MVHTSDYWKRGLGSPGIMLTDHGMSIPKDTANKKDWDAFDALFRTVFNREENVSAIKRLAVAILNTDIVQTGQMFEIDADGSIVESHVVQDRLRELLAAFMTV